MCQKYYHDPNDHCSRTFGHNIPTIISKYQKYPHKVVLVKPVTGLAAKPCVRPTEEQDLGKAGIIEEEPIADFGKITSVASLRDFNRIVPYKLDKPKKTSFSAPPQIINPKPVTIQVDDIKNFKLQVKAKGSFMFVLWKALSICEAQNEFEGSCATLRRSKIPVWVSHCCPFAIW